MGRSYRSAIFYTSDEQQTGRAGHDRGRRRFRAVARQGRHRGRAGRAFWEAEEEHQDYLQKYPHGYTCHYVRPGWKLPRRENQTG